MISLFSPKKSKFNLSYYYVVSGRHIGFYEHFFCAGSSVYNFKDNLFKIGRNKDDDIICELSRGFFDISNSKTSYGYIIFPKTQKKIKNFVSSKNRKL